MNNWTQDYPSYGAMKLFSREIWVYKDRWNYTRVQIQSDIERAYWAGSFLIVYLADGSCRRYQNYMNYERISG